MLAERALRKLAAAAKTGAVKAEKRREGGALSGPGRKVVGKTGQGKARGRSSGWEGGGEALFGEMLREAGGGEAQTESEVMGLGEEGVMELREEGVDVGMPEGVVVNWDIGGWRRGGRKGVRF